MLSQERQHSVLPWLLGWDKKIEKILFVAQGAKASTALDLCVALVGLFEANIQVTVAVLALAPCVA